jgi:uncharacterized integral membrane protein
MESENEPAQTPPVVSSEEREAEPQPAPEARAEPAPAPPQSAEHHVPVEIGPRFYATLAALLFFIAYSIAFIVGNDKHISIDFVFATAKVSVVWMILLLLAVGLVGGILLVELYRHRRGKQPRQP